MGVTREDLKRTGRYLEISDEEWAVELEGRQRVIDCYMKNDEWATKIHKNVGCLLTASRNGLPYLKGSIESHKKLGLWTVLAYDNFIVPEDAEIDFRQMPPKDVMDQVDTFLLSHHQSWGSVSYPYMWLLKLASGIMRNFEFVLCDNGDCIIENPDGFPKMLEELGDCDLMSTGPTLEREIGTAGLLCRSEALVKISKHLIDNVVPFENYEKTTQEFGNTEGRIACAVRDLGLKVKVVEPGYNEQLHFPGTGFWWKTIGYRHIHGEHNNAYRRKAIPPHYKYFDQRFMGDEYNQIRAYWEIVDAGGDMTQANEILSNWWAKD